MKLVEYAQENGHKGHYLEILVKGNYTFSAQLECDGTFNAGIRSTISIRHAANNWTDVVKEDYTAGPNPKVKTKVYSVPKRYYNAGERIYVYAKVSINGANPKFTTGGYLKATFNGQ
ncbi:hypothetical protein ACFYVL_33535 [Streptomyces sp. NPDC004111]|uniref:hypothetical protein n=1 Tax=Streptomyces sp. NPDC004111 TaxID=3364690 RepID=UPI00368F0B3B